MFSDNNIGFITWKIDRDGERDDPCFFSDYAKAKQDFAVRAELVPQKMLFTESQLTTIRSRLKDYMAIETALEPAVARREKDAIREVVDKIDAVVGPENNGQEEEPEELGYEQEDE